MPFSVNQLASITGTKCQSFNIPNVNFSFCTSRYWLGSHFACPERFDVAGTAITSGNCIRVPTSLEDGDGLLRRGLHLEPNHYPSTHRPMNQMAKVNVGEGSPLYPESGTLFGRRRLLINH